MLPDNAEPIIYAISVEKKYIEKIVPLSLTLLRNDIIFTLNCTYSDEANPAMKHINTSREKLET